MQFTNCKRVSWSIGSIVKRFLDDSVKSRYMKGSFIPRVHSEKPRLSYKLFRKRGRNRFFDHYSQTTADIPMKI